MIDGKFLTTAGGTAGVDMALFFVYRPAGEGMAEKVQLWIGYGPHPPFNIDWNHIGLMPRAMLVYYAIAAPFNLSS